VARWWPHKVRRQGVTDRKQAVRLTVPNTGPLTPDKAKPTALSLLAGARTVGLLRTPREAEELVCEGKQLLSIYGAPTLTTGRGRGTPRMDSDAK